MGRITSLQIDWYDNGLTCGDFIVHQVVTVYRRQNQIKLRGYNAICKYPQQAFDIPMESTQCEALFGLLERAEASGDFDQDFIVEVCDGSAWDMRLRHSDKHITLISGTVVYPAYGEEIENYIRTAIDQAHIPIDPMIFGCRTYEEEDE